MCIRDRYKTEERLSGGIRRSVVVGQLSARSQQSSVGEKKANTKHNGATRRILGTTVLPGEYEAQRCYQANTGHNGAARRILGTTVLPGEYEAQRCYQADTKHNGATRRIRSTTVLPGEYEAQRCYQTNTKHNGATRRIRSTTVLPGEYEAQRCCQANTEHNGAKGRGRGHLYAILRHFSATSPPRLCSTLGSSSALERESKTSCCCWGVWG